MLTEPVSPCGASCLRQFAGVSEKYITQVSGYPYLNFAVLFSNPLIRNKLFRSDSLSVSCVEGIANAADHEIGTVDLKDWCKV